MTRISPVLFSIRLSRVRGSRRAGGKPFLRRAYRRPCVLVRQVGWVPLSVSLPRWGLTRICRTDSPRCRPHEYYRGVLVPTQRGMVGMVRNASRLLPQAGGRIRDGSLIQVQLAEDHGCLQAAERTSYRGRILAHKPPLSSQGWQCPSGITVTFLTPVERSVRGLSVSGRTAISGNPRRVVTTLAYISAFRLMDNTMQPDTATSRPHTSTGSIYI